MNDREPTASRITGGVDTHKDTHTAAALDATGKAIGNATFPASAAGYDRLLSWLRSFGEIDRVGIEGTGSYGSGLAHHLRDEGVCVVEVNRPNRQARRRHGKSDPADAEAAARATPALRRCRHPEVSGRRGRSDPHPASRATLGDSRADSGRESASCRDLDRTREAASGAPRAVAGRPDRPRAQASQGAAHGRRVGHSVRPSRTGEALAPAGSRGRCARRSACWLAKNTALDLLALRGVGVDVACTLLVAAGDNPERLATRGVLCCDVRRVPVDVPPPDAQQRPPTESRRQPRRESRALGRRSRPAPLRPDPRARTLPAERLKGLGKPGNPALPEAIHRSRSLQDPERTKARERPPNRRWVTKAA